jgi:hypothetical protein
MKILTQDGDQAMAVARDVLEMVSDLGAPPEELIPGLIAAIGVLAMETQAPGQALDEAADLISVLEA